MSERTKQKIEACVWVVMFAIGLMLTSCSPKVIYVPEVHTDSIYITKHQKDSVWLHDSILVTEKGDTIRVEKWHTKYIERQVHDTCFVQKTDSVAVPYPREGGIDDQRQVRHLFAMHGDYLRHSVGIHNNMVGN